MDDVASDIRLGIAGVVDKQFRDAVYEFYRKVCDYAASHCQKLLYRIMMCKACYFE